MIWALLLLLSSGCVRCEQWQYHHTCQTTTDSARILYRSPDPTYGIDIEIVKTHGKLVTSFQVRSGSIPHTERRAKVTLRTPQESEIFYARLHDGDQRIRLSDPMQTAFISKLVQGEVVTIELNGYHQTIDPKHFEKIFKQLDSPPYNIPIRLPL